MRSWPVVRPPWKGWADLASDGKEGGWARGGWALSGFSKDASKSSYVSGIENGLGWEGMNDGGGNNDLGAGMSFLGASRRGSTDFL